MAHKPITVYCHTHDASGRKYVGQSVKGMVKRWESHLRDARYGVYSSPFHRAILKYGPDAFSHEVLCVCATPLEANAAEVHWIASLNTISPHGFNLNTGGHGASVAHPETRARMSAAQKKRNAAMTPERRSEIGRKAAASQTLEQRSARARKANASQTPEQRSDRMRRASASMTEEERSARGRKIWAGYTAEERSEIARKRTAAMTPEQRSARLVKAHSRKTPEQRSAVMVKANASRSKEKRSAISKGIHANLTPEQIAEKARKAWETRRERYGPKGTKAGAVQADLFSLILTPDDEIP